MTVPTTFPVAEQYGQQLLSALGSFWTYYFSDKDKLYTHLLSVGHRQAQAYLDYLEAVATISRYDVPIFHAEDWYLLTLRQSDRDLVYNVYGQEDFVYGAAGSYGDPQTREILFPLPNDSFLGQLKDIPYTIYNRVLYPSKTWTAGIDFDIDEERNLIRFQEDPFESGYVARRDIYDDNGAISDQEIGLWVYRGQWDVNYIYYHWAFAINMQLESSQYYKDLMNAVWDAYAFGSNLASMQSAIAAMLGVPFVLEPVEVVDDITTEIDRKLVITDKHVYEFSTAANIIVSVGDTVYAGQELSDAVTVVEFSGNTPDYSQLSAVVLGESYLSGGYYSELTFENTDVSVDYQGVDNDGKAVVTFRVQGFPGDVDLFFEKAMEIAKRDGKETLAELLDLRDSPSTQPLPANLPSQINPLEFAIEQIMRNNLWLLKIRTSAINEDAPGLTELRHFRNIVPPHTSLLIFVEISPDSDTMDLSAVGDAESPGADDEAERFYAAVPTAEDLYEHSEASPGDPSYQDVVVNVFKVSEVCR